MRSIVFMDTETTGLGPDEHIWEFAAMRRDETGPETFYHCFVQHNLNRAAKLPDEFRADHDARYNPNSAVDLQEFVDVLLEVFADRPHVIGAVPSFDTTRLAKILAKFGYEPPWHYHLHDVETLALGYLKGRAVMGDRDAEEFLEGPSVDHSDSLSRALGVDPEKFNRHTACGDVEWIAAQYDAITKAVAE